MKAPSGTAALPDVAAGILPASELGILPGGKPRRTP
jgi:hypothetical protein